MSDEQTELAPEIEVDTAAYHAAVEAFMTNEPHPKGFIWNSPAHRVGRALYAYEWAKREFPRQEEPDGRWSQMLPAPGLATAAVLAHEAKDN